MNVYGEIQEPRISYNDNIDIVLFSNKIYEKDLEAILFGDQNKEQLLTEKVENGS